MGVFACKVKKGRTCLQLCRGSDLGDGLAQGVHDTGLGHRVPRPVDDSQFGAGPRGGEGLSTGGRA